jgi:hypothetical protein
VFQVGYISKLYKDARSEKYKIYRYSGIEQYKNYGNLEFITFITFAIYEESRCGVGDSHANILLTCFVTAKNACLEVIFRCYLIVLPVALAVMLG